MTTTTPTALTAKENLKWTPLVNRVAAGDGDAGAELYARLRSIQFYFGREVGAQDAEDRYHSVMVAVIEAIRGGVLRDPEKVLAYARGIARRKVVHGIGDHCFKRKCEISVENVVLRDTAPNPEANLMGKEYKAIAMRILGTMPTRDREVLIRFYLHEHDAKSIQDEMGLTETQFRLIKSRAKARFADLVQRHLHRTDTIASGTNLGRILPS